MSASQFLVRWVGHPSHLMVRLASLVEQQKFTDVLLCCENKSVKAHRVVLAACSPYFETLLEAQLSPNPTLVFNDMSFGILKGLVEFMYSGETSVSQHDLVGLMRAAEHFQIKGLCEVAHDSLEPFTTIERKVEGAVDNSEVVEDESAVEEMEQIQVIYESPQDGQPEMEPEEQEHIQASTSTAELLLSLAAGNGAPEKQVAADTEAVGKMVPVSPRPKVVSPYARPGQKLKNFPVSSSSVPVPKAVREFKASPATKTILVSSSQSQGGPGVQYGGVGGILRRRVHQVVKSSEVTASHQSLPANAELVIQKEAEASRKAVEELLQQQGCSKEGKVLVVTDSSDLDAIANGAAVVVEQVDKVEGAGGNDMIAMALEEMGLRVGASVPGTKVESTEEAQNDGEKATLPFLANESHSPAVGGTAASDSQDTESVRSPSTLEDSQNTTEDKDKVRGGESETVEANKGAAEEEREQVSGEKVERNADDDDGKEISGDKETKTSEEHQKEQVPCSEEPATGTSAQAKTALEKSQALTEQQSRKTRSASKQNEPDLNTLVSTAEQSKIINEDPKIKVAKVKIVTTTPKTAEREIIIDTEDDGIRFHLPEGVKLDSGTVIVVPCESKSDSAVENETEAVFITDSTSSVVLTEEVDGSTGEGSVMEAIDADGQDVGQVLTVFSNTNHSFKSELTENEEEEKGSCYEEIDVYEEEEEKRTEKGRVKTRSAMKVLEDMKKYRRMHRKDANGTSPTKRSNPNRRTQQDGFDLIEEVEPTKPGELPKRTWECRICKKHYHFTFQLTIHRRYHTGERPYICEVCGKGFMCAGDLRRHDTVHRGDRPFHCDRCDKRFKLKSQVGTHMARVHLGVRPHVCDVCNAAFTDSSKLRSHMMVHTGDKPYQCTDCPKSFRTLSKVKEHIRAIHWPQLITQKIEVK